MARTHGDRYTAHRHLRASFGGGLAAGILLLADVIARKQLHASRLHVLALLLLPALGQFAAVAWNPTDPRRPLGKRPFRGFGIPARLLLLLPLAVPLLRHATPFVMIVAAVLVADALLLPVMNLTLARNYSVTSRGRWFGWATAAQALAIAAVAVPAGLALDVEPSCWPWLLAAAAVAGVYGYLQWSWLRRRARKPSPTGAVETTRSPWQVLRGDKRFLAYEAAVMVYGLGFMMLQPVMPIFLADERHATYAQVSLARGLLFYVATLLAGPVLGRVADRLGVLPLGAAAFLVLASFPLILLGLPGAQGLYAGYAVYGLAMAGVAVAWNLGPITLAHRRDPLPYLNAHIALVGIRALVGMPMGSWLQHAFGTRSVFLLVSALEVTAAGAMAIVALRNRETA